jgi:hypothetical protein
MSQSPSNIRTVLPKKYMMYIRKGRSCSNGGVNDGAKPTKATALASKIVRGNLITIFCNQYEFISEGLEGLEGCVNHSGVLISGQQLSPTPDIVRLRGGGTEEISKINLTFVNNQVKHYCNRSNNDPTSGSSWNLASTHHSISSNTNLADDNLNSLPNNNDSLLVRDVESNIGCCAIIEINGYLNLVQRLSNQGNVPANRVHRTLENYFQTIVEIVGKSFGDCITIEGETITAVWRSY